MLSKLCVADSALLLATPFRLVDLNDPASCEAATQWWVEMTAVGNEGMVVKPGDFICKGKHRLVQPAVKCRGPEYLRIIYGPEYLLPENLERLRARGVGAKRSLASREFALGIESLERFNRREPLRRTHECVFGVLALAGRSAACRPRQPLRSGHTLDIYYVGGFGEMGGVTAEDYRFAKIDPLADTAPRILEHMNSDHVPAMIQLAKVYAGFDATEAAMMVVDRLGFHLRLKTNDGMKGTRINFLREVQNSDEARKGLVELVWAAEPKA